MKKLMKKSLLITIFATFIFVGFSQKAFAARNCQCNDNTSITLPDQEAGVTCSSTCSNHGGLRGQTSSSTSTGFSTSMLNPNDGGISVPDSATTMIKNIITLVFVIAAVITFAYLVYGAISWITSGGDKSKVEAARNRITSAVIGLLILAATWAIFLLVMQIAFGSSEISIPSLGN